MGTFVTAYPLDTACFYDNTKSKPAKPNNFSPKHYPIFLGIGRKYGYNNYGHKIMKHFKILV